MPLLPFPFIQLFCPFFSVREENVNKQKNKSNHIRQKILYTKKVGPPASFGLSERCRKIMT